MTFEILSCFFCEFDINTGANIVCQYPKDYIKFEEFRIISKFLISQKEEIWNKIVGLKLGNSYLLGIPKYLMHKNYDRTFYYFNFCILVSQKEYESNYYLYELLIKKIGDTFEKLEIDSNFSFMRKNVDDISLFFENIYESAKKDNTINVNIKKGNINIEFFFEYFQNELSEIKSYLVPIWVKKYIIEDKKFINNGIEAIIQNINCENNLKQIVKNCDLSLNFVKCILDNLRQKGFISFIDIFRFDNIYRANKELVIINKDNLLKEFNEFCELNQNNKIEKNLNEEFFQNTSESSSEQIDSNALYNFYIELTKAKDVNDFLLKIDIKYIDIRLLIAFGIYKKMIRRVYPYCIFIHNKNENIGDSQSLLKKFDGNYNFDEICCENDLSRETLDSIISNFPKDSCFIIYK